MLDHLHLSSCICSKLLYTVDHAKQDQQRMQCYQIHMQVQAIEGTKLLKSLATKLVIRKY
jgi:hypothetical protein